MMKSPMAVRNPNTSGDTETQKDEFKLLHITLAPTITIQGFHILQ